MAMATRCTAEQLAETVTIWSIDTDLNKITVDEREDADELKPRDLLLSTIQVVTMGFIDKFETEWEDYDRQILLSKQNFIDYLKPRGLLLAESKECFNLILTCAFFSHEIYTISSHDCFHLSRVAFKLLKNILEDKFAEMFNTDSGWEELLSFCKKMHAAVFPSKENRPPDYDEEFLFDPNDLDPNVIYRTFCKEPASNQQLDEDEIFQQEKLDSSARDHDSKQLIGKTVSNEMAGIKSIDSPDIVDSTVDETNDDSRHCDSETFMGQIDHESIKDTQKCLQNARREQEALEFNNAEHDAKSIGPTVLSEMVNEKTMESPVIVESTDGESSDEDMVHTCYGSTRGRVNRESIKNGQNSLEDVAREMEGLGIKNEDDAKLVNKTIGNKMAEEKAIHSPFFEESSDDENLANNSEFWDFDGTSGKLNYWDFDVMTFEAIRKRITDSKEHLENILNLLAMIKGKIDSENVPSNKYDIPISDNEDIEELEKCSTKPNFSEWKISLSEDDVESIKKEICEEKNKKLGDLTQNLVRLEDITDGEIFQNVIDIFDVSDDEDQCEICRDKMLPFKTKWIESFRKKYSDNVSDFL